MEKKLYHGYWPHAAGGQSFSDMLSEYISDVGRSPAIVGLPGSWWYPHRAWDVFDRAARVDQLVSVYGCDAVPVVTWNPYGPETPDGRKITEAMPDDFRSMVETFKPASIAAGNHDEYIERWADGVASWGRPLVVRVMHEANAAVYLDELGPATGNLSIWKAKVFVRKGGPQINKPEDYVSAWRKIVDTFRSRGAENVLWLWSQLSRSSKKFMGNNWIEMSEIYPGSDYVDIVGFNPYCRANNWRSFHEIFDGAYHEAMSIAPEKPFWISEFGCQERPTDKVAKAVWIESFFSLLSHGFYPNVDAFLYWDNDKNDLRSSANAWSAYMNGIKRGNIIHRPKYNFHLMKP